MVWVKFLNVSILFLSVYILTFNSVTRRRFFELIMAKRVFELAANNFVRLFPFRLKTSEKWAFLLSLFHRAEKLLLSDLVFTFYGQFSHI